MLLLHIARILLSKLKSDYTAVVQQAHARRRLLAAEPSLVHSFGRDAVIDQHTTIGADCHIADNSTLTDSTLSRAVKIAHHGVVKKSTLADFVILGPSCTVERSAIGRYTYLGRECWLNDTTIGSFCSIAQNLSCGTGNHPLHMLSTSPLFYLNYEISFSDADRYHGHPVTTIGHDVWIGADVFIKSGVTIGNGAVIAAGAAVMKDVAPYAIVGGVPAREIRKRYSDADIATLEALQWWSWPAEELRAATPLIQAGDVPALRQWRESERRLPVTS